jgi:hypothetical protein
MKIKFGAIVVAGSGKIGGHVASKNRGGAYLRTKVTPTNPSTPKQNEVRALLGSLSAQWSQLTESERLAWNNAVKDFATTDIFGDIKNPSGINLFVKINANLASVGEGVITQVPQKQEVLFAPIDAVIYDVSTPADSTIDFNTGLLDGETLLISATPKVSNGTSFVKNLYRNISWEIIAAGAVPYGVAYNAKFGALVAGDVFFISVVVVTASGQKGNAQTVRVTAVA